MSSEGHFLNRRFSLRRSPRRAARRNRRVARWVRSSSSDEDEEEGIGPGVAAPNDREPRARRRVRRDTTGAFFREVREIPSKVFSFVVGADLRDRNQRAPRMASARGAFARLARATPPRLARLAPSRALASAAEDSAHADALRRAGATPPAHLRELLDVLRASGGVSLDPSDRTGVHPLVLPLARVSGEGLGGLPVSVDRKDETRASTSDERDAHATIGLLVRPADVRGEKQKELCVVASGPGGIELLAPSAAHHVHRMLVEEDLRLSHDAHGDGDGDKHIRPVLAAAGALGQEPHAICPPGTFRAMPGSSPKRRPEVFLQAAFSGCAFPSAALALIAHHETSGKDDGVLSALVTSEWYANQPLFLGWGFAHAANAFLLKKHGRSDEARDAARVALACAPWWTLSRDAGVAMRLAEVAGLREFVLLNEWGAEQFRDMLDTGGEEHKRAAEAMQPKDAPSSDEGVETSEASPFHASAREKKASALMDLVSLGAPADAKAETARSWDAVRGAVAEQYELGGLEAYAAFVRGE